MEAGIFEESENLKRFPYRNILWKSKKIFVKVKYITILWINIIKYTPKHLISPTLIDYLNILRNNNFKFHFMLVKCLLEFFEI